MRQDLRPGADTGKSTGQPESYSLVARTLHWTTVAFIFTIVPIALVMDGDIVKWSDAVGARLYDTHKLLGFIVLWVVVVRLAYRFAHGAPADEPTLEPWQKLVSHLTHWGIYALLLIVPLLGWFGVQLYPAVELFGGAIRLPSFVTPNEHVSEQVFGVHKLLAFALIGLIGMHVAAALYHYVLRKDGVLNRMLPSLPRRDGR